MPRERRRCLLPDPGDGDAVVADLAAVDVVEAVDEVGDGGLPRAGGAHQGDLLPRLGRNLDVVKDGLAGGIAEVHVVKDHLPRQGGVGDGAAVRADVLPGPLAGAVVGGDAPRRWG